MELVSNAYVIVPRGWQRLIEKDTVVYVSPDQSGLRSRDEVVRYLNSPMTCKCGLKCPFSFDEHFNFDPKVLSLPDSRPFAGYSDCSLIPSLYVDNRHNKKSVNTIPVKKGVAVSAKTKPSSNPQVKVKSKTSSVPSHKPPGPSGLKVTPQLKHMTIALNSVSTKKGIHMPSKTIESKQRQQPQAILTAPNGKGGEISYSVVDFQTLIDTLAKSGSISTSSYSSLLSTCNLQDNNKLQLPLPIIPSIPTTSIKSSGGVVPPSLSSATPRVCNNSNAASGTKTNNEATLKPNDSSIGAALKITATINPAYSSMAAGRNKTITSSRLPHVIPSAVTPPIPTTATTSKSSVTKLDPLLLSELPQPLSLSKSDPLQQLPVPSTQSTMGGISLVACKASSSVSKCTPSPSQSESTTTSECDKPLCEGGILSSSICDHAPSTRVSHSEASLVSTANEITDHSTLTTIDESPCNDLTHPTSLSPLSSLATYIPPITTPITCSPTTITTPIISPPLTTMVTPIISSSTIMATPITCSPITITAPKTSPPLTTITTPITSPFTTMTTPIANLSTAVATPIINSLTTITTLITQPTSLPISSNDDISTKQSLPTYTCNTQTTCILSTATTTVPRIHNDHNTLPGISPSHRQTVAPLSQICSDSVSNSEKDIQVSTTLSMLDDVATPLSVSMSNNEATSPSVFMLNNETTPSISMTNDEVSPSVSMPNDEATPPSLSIPNDQLPSVPHDEALPPSLSLSTTPPDQLTIKAQSMHGNENSSNNNTSLTTIGDMHKKKDQIIERLSTTDTCSLANQHNNTVTPTVTSSAPSATNTTTSNYDSSANGIKESTDCDQPMGHLSQLSDENEVMMTQLSTEYKPKRRTAIISCAADPYEVYNLRKRKAPYYSNETKRYKEDSPSVLDEEDKWEMEAVEDQHGLVGFTINGSVPDGLKEQDTPDMGTIPSPPPPLSDSNGRMDNNECNWKEKDIGTEKDIDTAEKDIHTAEKDIGTEKDIDTAEKDIHTAEKDIGTEKDIDTAEKDIHTAEKDIGTENDIGENDLDSEYQPLLPSDCSSFEWTPSPVARSVPVTEAPPCGEQEDSGKVPSSHAKSVVRRVYRHGRSGGSSVLSESDVRYLQRSICFFNEDSLVVSIPYTSLPNNRVLPCYSPKSFQVGDVVWAKATGLRGWPAKIISNKTWKKRKLSNPPEDQVWVSWYQFQSVSLVEEEGLKPLTYYDVSKKKNIKFNKAVKEAFIDLFDRQKNHLQL